MELTLLKEYVYPLSQIISTIFRYTWRPAANGKASASLHLKGIRLPREEMGTVVFPQAEKFFLDADVEERARRHVEFEPANKKISYNDVIKDIETRDRRDTTRNNSPLVRAMMQLIYNKSSIEEVFGIILKELEFIVKK